MLKNIKTLIAFLLGLKFKPAGQMVYAIFAGIILGLIFREKIAFAKILGDVFIRMITMTVVPLIFLSVTHSLCTMKDIGKTGKMAVQCIAIFVCTTLLTCIIGIASAIIFQPGVNSGIDPTAFVTNYTVRIGEQLSLAQTIINFFPNNPFKSFTEGDVIQILVFAIFFGVVINVLGSRVKNTMTLIEELSEIVYKLVDIIIKIAPVGIFGLVAFLAGTQDPKMLLSLLRLFVIFYSCGFGILLIVYPLILLSFGLNPWHFVKKIFPVQSFAYFISSSSATIPLNKFTTEKNLGVTEQTTAFCIPLGATINMNGGSLHFGLTSIFLAQVAGIDLAIIDYLNIAFLSLVLSIGTAGIPSATLVMMPMLLISIGVPPEYIGIYVGIDRFLDMFRTLINVTGDSLTAVIVDKSSKTLNIETYNRKEYQRFIK